jgi:hypothetical protein
MSWKSNSDATSQDSHYSSQRRHKVKQCWKECWTHWRAVKWQAARAGYFYTPLHLHGLSVVLGTGQKQVSLFRTFWYCFTSEFWSPIGQIHWCITVGTESLVLLNIFIVSSVFREVSRWYSWKRNDILTTGATNCHHPYHHYGDSNEESPYITLSSYKHWSLIVHMRK